MTSLTKFSRNKSENQTSLIICKFMPAIQCGVSTRDLLHSPVFGIGTVSDRILLLLCSKYHQRHCINKYEIIVNYVIGQTTIEEKKNDKSLNIIELKNFR